MKAAVLHQLGAIPHYEEFHLPSPPSDQQLVMTMKAASLKNLDKMRASGSHYASYTHLPTVVGIDGVGLLEDGRRVYAQGLTGTMAEKTLIHRQNYALVPEGLDSITASALPNAVIGAALALRYRARMQEGDVVLINGATGVTGKLAVQIAKHYGASRIIATGRNAESLEQLKALGADELISLQQEEESIIQQLKKLHKETPFHQVIDYLWGRPVELIITSLKGSGLDSLARSTRIVTVGEMAGPGIQLPSGILRSSAIEIMGSGIGSLSQEAMKEYITAVLPEMFELAAKGQLKMETVTAPLKDIESAWTMDVPQGKRLVIEI